MFSPCCMLRLLTYRASKRNKTNLQTAEFGQSQKQLATFELNLLKAGQKDRGLQKCLLFEPNTEAKASVSRSSCAWMSLRSQPAGSQLDEALGSCVSENRSNNLSCFSFRVSLAPWSLESPNRFPHPWQQIYARVETVLTFQEHCIH